MNTSPAGLMLLILLGLVGILSSLFVGLLASTGYYLFIMFGGVLCLTILIGLCAIAFRWPIRHLIFSCIFAVFFFINIIQARLGIPIYPLWQLAVIGIGTLGMYSLYRATLNSRLLLSSFVAFVVFMVIAFASSFGHGVIIKAAAFQFISDFKLPLAIAFGLFWAMKLSTRDYVEKLIWPYIILVFAFLLLQWAWPSGYMTVMNVASIAEEITSFLPSPGKSLFSHPSILAGVSAAFAIYYLSKWQIKVEKDRSNFFKFILVAFLLFASNQRQEIFAFLLVAIGLYIIKDNQQMAKRIFLAGTISVVLGVVFFMIYEEAFKREIGMWGIDTYQRSTHPRAQLYEGAELLAKTYFPLGSGLGTFGGVGSMKYDLLQYYKLGFAYEWWWNRYEAYLLDTYWPNSIAESGFIGASFLLLHYLLFAAFLVRRVFKAATKQLRLNWLIAAGAFSWILLVTPTSPGFQELLILFLPGIFIANAIVDERKYHASLKDDGIDTKVKVAHR